MFRQPGLSERRGDLVFPLSASLPQRRGVIGLGDMRIGASRMMIALAAMHNLPVFWCRLRHAEGRAPEDADGCKPSAHFIAHGTITSASCRNRYAGRLDAPGCAPPGGDVSFWARPPRRSGRRTLGCRLTHSAPGASATRSWLDMARSPDAAW